MMILDQLELFMQVKKLSTFFHGVFYQMPNLYLSGECAVPKQGRSAAAYCCYENPALMRAWQRKTP